MGFLVVLHLLLLLYMVNVVWVLVPPTFHPRKFSVSLVLVILCHIKVVITY